MIGGQIKLAACTPELCVADCDYNAGKIIEQIFKADAQGCELICFPQMSITGASCGDLFSHSLLTAGAQRALSQILEKTESLSATFAVGYPLLKDGRIFSAAALCRSGKVLHEFCEDTCFKDVFSLEGLDIGMVFGIDSAVCETLALKGARLILMQTARPAYAGSFEGAGKKLSTLSARLGLCIVCADAGEGESTTDMVFGGNSIICSWGTNHAESRFLNGLISTELNLSHENTPVAQSSPCHHDISRDAPLSSSPFLPQDPISCQRRCEEIFEIAARGLKKRMMHTGVKKLVLGISGGLDSTLAALIAARALKLLSLPTKNLIAVTMPGFGTTVRTRGNAEILAEGLFSTLRCIDITPAVRQHFSDIGHDEKTRNAVYENAQARERTQILMDIANGENALVVGTGDMSELALGWATFNGDHMSMYAVNAGIPKTVIRRVVSWYSQTPEGSSLSSVLSDILATPVSPELLPAENGSISQITEDLVGPYELHDFFLWHFVGEKEEPQRILSLAETAFDGVFAPDFIKKWLIVFIRRFFSQQFKRSCMPDGPMVLPISLSPRVGLTLPSDAVCSLWLKELL